MLEELKQLEIVARRLDPGPDRRKELFDQFQDYTEAFLEGLPARPTYIRDEGRAGFPDPLFGEAPADLPELLAVFSSEVDTTGILPASGGQMGYIPGGGLYPSALADFLAAISNRYSGVAFASPGGAAMEGALVKWMCDLVGYPEDAAGDLTSGGSLATLSALVAARDAHSIGPVQIPKACVYLTEQAHHCVSKALHVAGLGASRKRIVPMDPKFRMDVAALRALIAEDQERGLQPWLIVASAGTTDTGAVDPITDIAAVAEQSGLWFHLDAAYGGFFMLCPEGRERLAGLDRADSIVMDPHKGLGLPYGTGAVLVREGRLLAESNSYYADYMQDAKPPGREPDTGFSPADYSLELTRHFRGPRMWFPLKLFGLEPFRASLEEKIWLARYFHQALDEMEGFQVGPYPDLSIVTFRYLPKDGDDYEVNKHLLEAIHEDGRVFITSTLLDGKFTLRLAVLNFRTHLETVDYLLGLLERLTSDWRES